MLHCFSGTEELARRALDAGYLLSFAGNLTYKKADNLRRVASSLPSEAILIETDAPYLSPVSCRGRRNEPAYLVETLRVLADVKGIEWTVLAERLRRNCSRLFGWPAQSP